MNGHGVITVVVSLLFTRSVRMHPVSVELHPELLASSNLFSFVTCFTAHTFGMGFASVMSQKSKPLGYYSFVCW